jgi:hypothetical protein
MNRQFKIAVLGSFSLLLASCGGGGSSSAPGVSNAVGAPVSTGKATAQGVFKDSNVAGLKYISGAIAGVTDAQGQFTYEVGESVTFLVGNTLLGSTLGADVITPIDLVEGGGLSDQKVKNIVKLLMLVDSDGKAENGINIDEQLQRLANSWPQVDLTVPDLAGQLSAIQSDISSIYGGVRALVDDVDAVKHFGDTLSCLYSGAFVGQRDGHAFTFTLDPHSKIVSGFSRYSDELVDFTAAAPVVFANKPLFSVDSTALGLVMDAEFKTPNGVEGVWADDLFNGAFSAVRLGSMERAQHRISGSFTGGKKGVFELKFDGNTVATGTLYDIGEDKTYVLDASLVGDRLTVSASNGMTFTLSIDGDFGSVSGSWLSSDQSQSGTVNGSGCVSEQTIVQDFCPLLEDGVALRVNYSSATSFIEQHLNTYPVGLSLSSAVAGVLGGDVEVDLGQVDSLFGKAKVIAGQKLVPVSEAFSGSSSFVLNTGFGSTLSVSAAVSLIPNTDLELSYTCTDSVIQVTGPFSVSGNATTSVSTFIGNIDLNVNVVTSGEASAVYTLQGSPTGGLWLTK